MLVEKKRERDIYIAKLKDGLQRYEMQFGRPALLVFARENGLGGFI
jgi:hypothetical protein